MKGTKVLETAVEFDIDSLLAMLSVLVSERLQCAYQGEDGALDNLLASLLDIEDVTEWKPDASFWSSIRSRKASPAFSKGLHAVRRQPGADSGSEVESCL